MDDFIDKVLSFFENWLLFLMIMVCTISLFSGIVMRYCFSYAMAWPEELGRFLQIGVVFFGCSAAVKARSMIRIDIIYQIVRSPKGLSILNIINEFFGLCYCICVIYLGLLFTQFTIFTQQKSVILNIPMCCIYGILPLTGIMMLIRTCQNIYKDYAVYTPYRK